MPVKEYNMDGHNRNSSKIARKSNDSFPNKTFT